MDTSQTMVTQVQFPIRQASILFAIFCLVYFVELASFPLSIDEEVAVFRTDAAGWVAQGRWGAYLFEALIMPQPILPFITPAIFGLGCVVSYLLVMDMIGQRELSLREYGCFVVFCGFPTWFFIVEFYSNIAAVGLAFALMTFALWLNSHANGSRHPILMFIGATAAGAVALSIYQALVPAMLTMGLAVAILQAQHGPDRPFVREIMRVVLLLVSSLATYAVVQIIFKLFIPLQSDYFNSLFQLDLLLQDPVGVVSRTLLAMADAIGLREDGYEAALWAIPPLLVLGVATILFGPSRRKILLAAAAAIAFAAPFGLDLVSGGYLPTRSLIGLPIAVWLLTYVAVQNRNSKLRIAGGGVLAVAIFQILVMQNAYQASNSLAAKHDAVLAASIQDRLSTTPGFDPDVTYALSIFGGRPFTSPFPKPKSSSVGHSFFEYDGGNRWRIVYYMRLLGFTNLKGATTEQINETIAHLATLPVWPAPGSVEIDGEIVLVRLNEMPSDENLRAMEQARVR